MKLTYHRCGDYWFPDLGLSDLDQKPVGKYGLMRQDYLQHERPGFYTRLLLSGELMAHLHEIDLACHERLELLLPQMKALDGVTEQLKSEDQLEWVRRMDHIRDRIEEILRDELIYA